MNLLFPPFVRAFKEIRTGVLAGDQDVSNIEVDAQVILTVEDVSGESVPEDGNTDRKISIDYQSICKTVSVGKLILLDDGLIALEVLEVDPHGKFVVCKALNGGPIKKNKGVNLPGMELDLPALTEKDKRDLQWACEMGADYIAASFIRTGSNVRSVIAYLNRCIASLPELDGFTRLRPLVISKIENKEGVDHFDEILKESDGIMVARGGAYERLHTRRCRIFGCTKNYFIFAFWKCHQLLVLVLVPVPPQLVFRFVSFVFLTRVLYGHF